VTFWGLLYGYVNWGIGLLGAGYKYALAQLPTSPLRLDSSVHDGLATGMGWATYFVPVHEFIVTLGSLVSAILVWYLFRILLRWAKAAASG
jgi:hypothetical protein